MYTGTQEKGMIDIAAGKSTPRILLNRDTHQFLIEGQSYPENSTSFYQPVIDWLKEYITAEEEELLLKIKLLYINTSSTKALMYLLDLLEDAFREGREVGINWYYDRENEMARETGEELKEDLSLPFSIIEV